MKRSFIAFNLLDRPPLLMYFDVLTLIGAVSCRSMMGMYCYFIQFSTFDPKQVPFLDVCNTMLNPSLPLTSLDYEEFGDPRIEAEFELIRSYSPYDNIPLGTCHPPVLVTASFHDSR